MKLSTLENSLKIIEVLSKNIQGLNLSEIAKISGFHKSTIHHVLSTFVPHGYVVKDPQTKKYSLGFKFLEISKRILDNLDIRNIANPYIRELHNECKEAVHLYILRNGKIICTEKSEIPSGLSLATYVGFSTEPHAAAAGKVLLSELSQKEIKRIYQDKPLKIYGKNTIADLECLFEELEIVRDQGYAVDDEEYYEGVRCVAAPIRSEGKIVGALSITGSVFTMTKERIYRELTGLVKEKACEISSKLHWQS